MSGRKQWNKQAATSSFLDKKPLESLILQGLEGSTTLRNQQVMCSSHTTSSKKHRKLQVSVDKEVFKIIENTNFIDRRQR